MSKGCINVVFLDPSNWETLLSPTPLSGDFIHTCSGQIRKEDFNQSVRWSCRQVLEVHGNYYRINYGGISRWYKFEEFGRPKIMAGRPIYVYPALPPGHGG